VFGLNHLLVIIIFLRTQKSLARGNVTVLPLLVRVCCVAPNFALENRVWVAAVVVLPNAKLILLCFSQLHWLVWIVCSPMHAGPSCCGVAHHASVLFPNAFGPQGGGTWLWFTQFQSCARICCITPNCLRITMRVSTIIGLKSFVWFVFRSIWMFMWGLFIPGLTGLARNGFILSSSIARTVWSRTFL